MYFESTAGSNDNTALVTRYIFYAQERGKKMHTVLWGIAYQHGSDSYVPLLSSGHPGPSLVRLVDSPVNQDVEADHDEARDDPHENEIGHQDVILDVSDVRAQIRLSHFHEGPVHHGINH